MSPLKPLGHSITKLMEHTPLISVMGIVWAEKTSSFSRHEYHEESGEGDVPRGVPSTGAVSEMLPSSNHLFTNSIS